MSGDLDGAESRLDDAEAALAAGARDQTLAARWADTEDLRTAPATISVYRASLAQARGDVAATVRHARRALDLAGPDDHFVRGAGGGFLGLAAWASGNVNEARAIFSDAVRSLHAAGNFVDELDSTVVLADMWVASGRPSRARRLYEQALQAATAGGPPYPRATADLHVGLAELDRELNHLETRRHTSSRLGFWVNGPPSPRTSTAGTSSWRRYALPAATTTRRCTCLARPRRFTGTASTPTPAHRRVESSCPDRRRQPVRSRPVGRGSRSRRG